MRCSRVLPLTALTLLGVSAAAEASELAGPYAGVSAGSAHFDTTSAPFSTVATPIPDLFFGDVSGEGASLGGLVGYRWQFDRLTLGVEADGDLVAADGGKSSALAGISVDARYAGAARVLAGWSFGPVHVYGAYGVATARFDYEYRLGASTLTSVEETPTGTTAGVGVEWRMGRFHPRLEYRETDFETFTHAASVFTYTHDLNTSAVRLAVTTPLQLGG